MKALKASLTVVAGVLAVLAFGAPAYAFHSGGAAECTGCHSMHSPATPNAQGGYLLIKSDKGSTCLSCHENATDTTANGYHVSTLATAMPAGTPPLQRTPGGDFGWLKKTFSYTVRGSAVTEDGAAHGHNIVAADFGYVAEGDGSSQSPGGTYYSANLSCVSCHDPHGKYRRDSTGTISTSGAPIIGSGSYQNSTAPATGQAVGVYRLLYGNGGGDQVGGPTFPGVPVAVTNSTYNRPETAAQTRTAYGFGTSGGQVGWAAWCGTCHGAMHSNNGANYVHPTDEAMDSSMRAVYTAYRGSGKTSGDGLGYLSLVPFAENTQDYTVLAGHAQINDSQLGGPGANDRVTCLSCHRAHASGFAEALRWNMEGELIIVKGSWPGKDLSDTTIADSKWSQGRTYAEMKGAYNDYSEAKFGTYQRVLCNKCHAKD